MHTGTATVRPAEPSDIDAVRLLAQAFATSFVVERAAFDRTYPALVATPDALLLVGTAPELGVTGYLLAHTHPTLLANGPVAWIEEVMVDPRARRRGIGRDLVTAAEDWARSAGARYVSLASRRAGPFYLALGYQDSAVFFRKSLDAPA
ncbi:MAG TPA: GNAT family N-acetyltransferase [Cellulomonas sp.]